LPTIVSKSDGNSFDLSEEKPMYLLRNSKRSVIVGTNDRDYYMACIETGVGNATLVDDHNKNAILDDRDWGAPKPVPTKTRFSKDVVDGFQAGMFEGYSLELKFRDAIDATREITLPSTCDELRSRFTTLAELKEFTTLCKRRIFHLLTTRDPDRQQNEIVVFCQHAGCVHEEGFLFSKRPINAGDYHRVGSVCPMGHSFCLRCLQQDHEGFCPDIRQEREELAAVMPGQKMCPTCRAIIFKIDGCNHMHCAACDQHFCWTCSKRFSSSERYSVHGTCSQFD
jgi:hypothetical protein